MLWQKDSADIVNNFATSTYAADFALDYREYDVLAGWDVENLGTGSDPVVSDFGHNRVDFGLFLLEPVLYEAGAMALSTSMAAIAGLMLAI